MISVSSNRRVVKLDKPRTMKATSVVDQSLETVLSDMDAVSQRLGSSGTGNLDKSMNGPIASLCENLRLFGPQLESVYKDQLDRCFVSLRNGCRDDRLSLASRYRLLEVIELRAMHWQANENLSNYYKQKLAQIEAEENALENQSNLQHTKQIQPTDLSAYINAPAPLITPTQTHVTPHTSIYTPNAPTQYPPQHFNTPQTPTTMYTPQYTIVPQQQQSIPQIQHQTPQITVPPPQVPPPPPLNPGEVVKSSGKYNKATRIAGKNYCKDEVVIRNADSGKVMGMKGRRVHLIEELSETVISFQRVAPGARERLVQITGPNEENISHAVMLIEETIRRNASPVRPEDEQPTIYATHGGSTSSISSQTSDDALPGTKRAHLSSLTADDPLTEYKYTVLHNGDSIKITGSNLDLVRTAKLILDEHLNGEPAVTNGFSSLTSTLEAPKEKQPNNSTSVRKPSPPPTVSLTAVTTPATQAVINPPLVSPSRPPATQASQEEFAASKGQVLTVVRQPLIPCSPKEVLESTDTVPQGSDPNIKNRRTLFAKTSDEKAPDGEASEPTTIPERAVYTRDFVLTRAGAKHSRLTPKDWANVLLTCPAVVKKGSQHLAALQAKLTEKGEKAVNSAPTYLKAADLINPSEFVKVEQKWSLLRTSSANEEEEVSGNSN